MGEMTAQSLGARIREARQRVGMSQQMLAERVGLDRTAVNKIESGNRKISAIELSDVADALRVRMVAFFEEPLSAVVAHRSAQGLDVVDSQIDAVLAEIAEEVRFVDSLRAVEAVPPARAWDRPASDEEAEAMAEQARVLIHCEQDDAVTGLVDRLAAAGLLVFTKPLGPDTADAGTVLIDRLGVSLVNSTGKVGRRRLAAAHEFGHFLVRDAYTVDWRIAEPDESLESKIDYFARALLLPRNAVAEQWHKLREHSGLRAAAVIVGSDYRVDMSTLARRLVDLGVVNPSDAGQVRMVRTTRTDIIELDLHPDADEMTGVTQPRAFQRAVIDLVRDERLSAARAAELLWHLVDEEELPRPRMREAGEIWEYVS
ncbi:helix-turn-helix domain-containing protein [Actinomyces qiguomingii]|uniref:helix-turn-helix domain-containing protein n=1 Tax=Actinomyces qiguomingii TaxID=2057800 RepID=UPI000CA06207|nr:XRE family transcriptional regulator [Actinomyces qiguomingii]